MNRLLLACLFAAVAIAPAARSQVSFTGQPYSQNFDTLPGAANNALNLGWTNNITLPGWYANKATYSVTDGTVGGTATTYSPTAAANPNNVGLFSFGTAGSTDRALGSRATAAVAGNNPVLYGVRLVNNSGKTLTSFTVTFTGEQWFKSGKTTTDTLLVDYQLGATSIAAGTWANIAGGTFSSLVNTATAATVAGNTAANRRGLAARVTGISWAPGAELWVRIRDDDQAGDEQGLAVDDFVFLADEDTGLFFNGSTSYVTMGFGAPVASLNASSFTVETRFMRTGPGVIASTGTGGVTTAIPLVAKGVGEADGTPVDADYFLGIDSTTGKLVADFEQRNATNNGTAYPAGQNFPVFGSTVLQNGVFYHVAATYDTTTAVWQLYVNGVAEPTTQTLPTFVGVVPNDINTQGLGIGTTINSTGARSGFFQGIIDEVRIWNYARSAADILANRDVRILASTPGLLGRYGFDEGSGTNAAGIAPAGAAPAGTLSGSPLPIWVNSQSFTPNILPSVTVTSPAPGANIVFPASIALEATATDSDGLISKVEFFNGATKLGEDTTAPYQFAWAGATVGSYTLTAVATDNAGGTATSPGVAVTVQPNPNQPPVIGSASPSDNASGVGSSTVLELGLADPEGDAQTVTFYGRATTPAAPGADFAFIAIPDTQYYSENTGRVPSSTGNPAIDTGAVASIYYAQTQWIVNNRDALRIPFVSHMGDIAQNGDAFESEWIVADAAMAQLENPATTRRGHGIPWGVAPGNHDQQPVADAGGVTNFYTKYFNFTRWDYRPYYGGHFGNKPVVQGGPTFPANTNNYELFSASGLDFIVIHLEYDARAVTNYQSVLDWADELLKAYPDRRAIVTSHWTINTGNPATFSTQGQAIYDNLKDNPNLFLLLGGHVHGEGRRADTFEGRTVYSILSDYQEANNGGNGFLRILTFQPALNRIHVESYSPTLNRAVNASDAIPSWTAAYDLPYNLQSAVTDWIPLGTASVPAGGTAASLPWTGLEAGKAYEWYATVSDGINTVATPTRRFTTAASTAPEITLTAPADGAIIALPTSVTLTASASDADGAIARVEFFLDDTRLTTLAAAPYTFDLGALATGTYALTAVATDDTGLDAVSNVVSITVINPGNVAPSVNLTSPANGAVLVSGTIALAADATDSDGTIARVEFYQGTTKLGQDTSAPYTFSWSGAAPGSYTLTAVAIDNDGGTTSSAPVALTLIPVGGFFTSYLQNFDALGTAGTAPPGAWTVWNGISPSANSTWINTNGILGGASSVANTVGAMTVSTAALTATAAPTATNNNGYNAAAPGNTGDRMLATSPTSFSGTALQLDLTNVSGASIPDVKVSYDIRRFLAVATANELPGYWLFYSLDNGVSWTNVPALNPTLAGPTGVIVPNTVGVTSVPATNIGLSSLWTVGSRLLLRWIDDNAVATSPDQIAGLDNVVVTAVPFLHGFPPSVALTSPAPGATFTTLGTVNLAADATDTDGTIAKVEYFAGAVKIGEAFSPPFAASWTGLSTGTYSLTARATDNDDNAITSAARSITVVTDPSGPSGALLRSPYLNMANDTSIVIRWRTANAVFGRVRYGTSPGSLTGTQNEPVARTDHEVRITGLTPDTRYYYSVGGQLDTLTPEPADNTVVQNPAGIVSYAFSTPTAADYTFRTSPVPGTATNTRIWVVGDAGRGSNTQAAGRNAYYNWMGSRVPDFTLMLGDNAYDSGTDLEYQSKYFLMYSTIFRKLPQWSTLGNHDANNGVTNPITSYPYFDMFTFPTAGEAGGVPSGTEHYYSFDYGNVHVISLDSQTTLANSTPTAPQTVWLQADLASTTQPWIIVIFHHPPYSKGSHNSDTEAQMVTMRTVYNPIFEAGGVDLVLTGHSHNYERSVLLDGHYGISTTISPSMKLNAGNGSTTGYFTSFTTAGDSGKIRNAASGFNAVATVNGAFIPPDGAYIKPQTGPRDHFGTIYNTAGSSGQADGGSIDHTAMYISYDTVGTVNLDIDGDTLVATYVQADGNTPDNYTIVKQGAADSDHDGIPDQYEIANALDRKNALDAGLDRDGDGLSNRLEYALDTAANIPNRAGLPVLGQGTGADAGKLTLSFNRARPELTYVVQASDDLKAWSDLTTNPGTPGSLALVTDSNTASPNRFLRLKVINGTAISTTTPVGRMATTLGQGQEIPIGFSLELPLGPITGAPAGFITGVTPSSLADAAAGWSPGALSTAGAPYLVRIISGAATGLVLPIDPATPNTATSLSLVTEGLNLTTLGIVPGVDSYELVPADTLESLFPVPTLQTGASLTTADSVRMWNGTAWVSYFNNGAGWQRSGAGAAPNLLVRPDRGWILKRVGPTKTFMLFGQVSSTSARVAIPRSATTFAVTLPVEATFDQFALQTALPGWSSNVANPTAGDQIRIWSGATWLVYYYDPALGWRRQGVGAAGTVALNKPGRPFLIVRPAGAGTDLLLQQKPY